MPRLVPGKARQLLDEAGQTVVQALLPCLLPQPPGAGTNHSCRCWEPSGAFLHIASIAASLQHIKREHPGLDVICGNVVATWQVRWPLQFALLLLHLRGGHVEGAAGCGGVYAPLAMCSLSAALAYCW